MYSGFGSGSAGARTRGSANGGSAGSSSSSVLFASSTQTSRVHADRLILWYKSQGPPTPQVLSLLDHLTSLNCKTLYLPPSLPPNLITLLNAIQLRSSIKPETFLAPEPEQDEDPSAPEGKPTSEASRGEGEKLLSAEAMDPRDDKAMLAFVRLWAKTDNAAGGGGDVGAGGRKVDAVVWAYGVGNVLDSSLLSPTATPVATTSDRFLTPEEDERTRFLFFTLFLPQILNSTKTSSRSIRLVTLLHPIFPAGFSTSPLLHPSSASAPTTTVTNDAGVTTTVDPLPPASYALRESYHAVRSILFTSHLQRILDALAMKGEAEAAEVPEGADESVKPRDQQEDDEDVAGAAAARAEAATKPPVGRRSNILAVSVAPGWHTSSVLRPFIGNEWKGNPVVALM